MRRASTRSCRDEFLAREVFASVKAAQGLGTAWRVSHNEHRRLDPHSRVFSERTKRVMGLLRSYFVVGQTLESLSRLCDLETRLAPAGNARARSGRGDRLSLVCGLIGRALA